MSPEPVFEPDVQPRGKPVTSIRMLVGFVAGFIAVLIFQQPILAVLHGVGVAARSAYSTEKTLPLATGYVWSRAFWGGVWGVVLAMIDRRFPAGARYWLAAIVFGAIGPTILTWILALAGTGRPPGGILDAGVIITPFVINAAWGFGAALILWGFDAALRYNIRV